MSCMLRRHIDLVVFGIEKQIVKVILYKLLDQYCHKLECRGIWEADIYMCDAVQST